MQKKLQKRDDKGRFLPVDKAIVYTLEDIKDAFIAGLNSHSRIYTPSQLFSYYKQNNKLD